MAYRELVKNFEGIRAYMREFYVYGLKTETSTIRKAPVPMMMNAAGWRAGWESIWDFARLRKGRMFSCLWTAA